MELISNNPTIASGIIAAGVGYGIDYAMPPKTSPEFQASGLMAGPVGYAVGGMISYKLIEMVTGAEPLTGVVIATGLMVAGRVWMNS